MIRDPIELTVWRHLLAALTEEMGVVLMRSAFSPNIKERRDYSCALFDADGEMVAHAAHIPVHLGSTPMSVAAVLEDLTLGPGDVALVNDPYRGGTHLPDLTMVAPVFTEDGARCLGYVVNRAHHADVGGTTPGSMPLGRHIDEEGVRLPPLRIVEAGVVDEALLEERLFSRVRTPDERRGDLAAQRAACFLGAQRLLELVERHGEATIRGAMAGLVAHAERMMTRFIESLPDGRVRHVDFLDDDGLGHGPLEVVVELTVEGSTLCLDFRESADAAEGPVNAVRAIAVSASLYVLRCLAPADLPASTGALRPVEILTRRGSLIDADYPAPVAAGNVETSQRLVDVLFGAFESLLPGRIPAASQGTMNNVTLGGTDPSPWTYYETLGGGTGGSPDAPGASAIHSHMTNTLNTPVEALEHEAPLRVETYGVRRGSGGAGQHPGGDGLVRRWRALAPMTATLLGERRGRGAPGASGGEDGAPGQDRIVRAGGRTEALPGKVTVELESGDVLEVETPGGGGWGKA